MGVYHHVFIGPYAEFRVPRGTGQRFPPEDADGEILCGQELACYDDMYGPPETCRYVPHGHGQHKPPRAMYLEDKSPILEDQDWTTLDLKAEMKWLAKTYADEIRILTEQFGSPPS